MGSVTTRARSTIKTVFAIAGTALLAVACGSGGRPSPTQLRDTTGMTFQWECDDKRCRIGPMPAFETCSAPSGYSASLDHFFSICSAFDSGGGTASTWRPEDCRIAACTVDADCPIFQGATYNCHHGLCGDEANPMGIDGYALAALCLSSTTRPTECGLQDAPDVDALIAANCVPDGGCAVPTTCRQP